MFLALIEGHFTGKMKIGEELREGMVNEMLI